ncbi:MAG TPA: murein transglycosylase [Pseudonocardiaceae bacterium]|nr:murein transglycosylase [Pseudonocardiaceae bacterium]
MERPDSDAAAGVDLVLPEFDEQAEPPPRHRWGRWVFLLLVLALIATAGLIWRYDVHMTPHTTAATPEPPAFSVQLLEVTPGTAVPATGGAVPGVPAAQTAFVDRVSGHTDIPRRVLTAYLHAQAVLAAGAPACHLSWTMLAGVGWVESQHGEWHGDSVTATGEEATPIIGPALDGSAGMQKIGDTDHGRLDGDTVWDHAVGPMQFLPATWLVWGVRASGDGKPADPQDIDDAALTAGRYLCAQGGDLATPAGWWAATWVYNNSATYGQTVFSGATAYALASR